MAERQREKYTALDRAIEEFEQKSKQRERFFRDDHKLQIQSSVTSMQEYEELLFCWDRQQLRKVVLPFVRNDPEAADDIIQDAFLRGYFSLKKGVPNSVPRKMLKELKVSDEASQNLDLNQQKVLVDNPSAWMYTILRHTALNYVKREDERKRTISMNQLKSEQEDPRFERVDIVVEHKERDDKLHRHVATLSHPFAQIIRQHFFEGMKLKDIADELGYPHSTIRVYMMRGLQRLKEIYEGERELKGGRMAKKRRQVI